MKDKEQKETKINVMTGWRQQLIYTVFLLNYLARQVYIRDLRVVIRYVHHRFTIWEQLRSAFDLWCMYYIMYLYTYKSINRIVVRY